MTVTPAVALLIIVQFAAGNHQLTCLRTIKAAEGEDVTLRCRLDPPIDLSASTLDVARVDHGDNDGDVYVYQRGKDQPEDQSPRYRDRTTLIHEDLIGGNVTLQISSVNLSDSGAYRVNFPGLPASFIVNVTVVSKDQENRTKRPDSSTSGPPVEEVTESEHRGDSAKEESVWKILVPSVCGAAAGAGLLLLLLLLLLLVKRGVIRIWKKTNEAETRPNSLSVKYERTPGEVVV